MVTAGFRGAVSLAAALAVPLTLSSGAPFPHRDLIIFVTTGVVVLTLVVQGLLLAPIVRWAQLPVDTGIAEELQLARVTTTEEALHSLQDLAETLGVHESVTARLALEYQEHLDALRAEPGDEDEIWLQHSGQDAALRLALIKHKRGTLLRLRDERRIDDTVLRQVQRALDIEEERLSRPHEDP
jgi:NhaP-type Na+/H+ or K+/H+ antiporter